MTRTEAYARAFDRAGRRVALQRNVANGQPVTVANVRVRIWDAEAEEIVGGTKSTRRRIIVLAADVPDAFRPLRAGDLVVADGQTMTFVARPDDQTRRIGDTLLAYEGLVSGR